jgi:hypothetical protein
MIFSSHPKFDKEMKCFLKKHHQDDGWMFKLQNLLTSHYELGTIRLNAEVLGIVGEWEGYRLIKIYMAVGGVSKNDRPRICFAQKNQVAIFLCFGTHIENYNTRELVALGKARLKEFIGV